MFGVGLNPVYLECVAERERKREKSGAAALEWQDAERALMLDVLFEESEVDTSVSPPGSTSYVELEVTVPKGCTLQAMSCASPTRKLTCASPSAQGYDEGGYFLRLCRDTHTERRFVDFGGCRSDRVDTAEPDSTEVNAKALDALFGAG